MSHTDALRAAVGAQTKNLRTSSDNIRLPPAVQPGCVQQTPVGTIAERIDKGERTLEFFRRGDCGRSIGELGQQVCLPATSEPFHTLNIPYIRA